MRIYIYIYIYLFDFFLAWLGLGRLDLDRHMLKYMTTQDDVGYDILNAYHIA